MTSYNELMFEWNGQKFVFVTRGRSKSFTPEEALSYLNSRFEDQEAKEEGTPEPEEESKSGWRIPDDKARRHIFHRDLQSGIKFCIKKYGQDEETIKAEAKRLSMGGF